MIETSSPAASSKADVPTFSGAVGFTPGPWSLVTYHRTGHSGLIPVWYIKASNDVGIAVQPSFSCPDHEAANARLIAAAPALYEALEKVCGYLLNAQIDIETGAKRSTAVATIQGGLSMARAALKLARGE